MKEHKHTPTTLIYALLALTAITLLAPQALGDKTSGLVECWTYDAADISGATISGSLGKLDCSLLSGTVNDSLIGEGIYFDGSSDYGQCEWNQAFSPLSDQDIPAVYCWRYIMKSTQAGGEFAATGTQFEHKGQGGASFDWAFNMMTYTNNSAGLWSEAGGTGGEYYVGNVVINDGAYHEIVYCRNNTGSSYQQVYIDGALVTQETNNRNIDPGNSNVSIGVRRKNDNTKANYYAGIIDEVAYWNRTLTAAEVADIYGESCSQINPTTFPPSINWDGYPPPNATRNNTANVAFYYNATGSGAEYCELYNTTSYLANSTVAVTVNTKTSLNATGVTDGLEGYQIRCMNTSVLYNSSWKYFEVDTTEPALNFYSPVSTNTSAVKTGNSYVLNFTAQDANLFSFNVTGVDAGGTVRVSNYTENLTSTSYNYTRTIDTSTGGQGIWVFTLTSYDDHNQLKSSEQINRVKEYEADSTTKGGRIGVKDQTITIEPNADDFKTFTWTYDKNDTNWHFDIETKTAKKIGETLIIELYAEKPFLTRYSSGHVGHLITGENYVDFDGLDAVAETVIDAHNPSHATVTLTFQSDQKQALALKSVGELNKAQRSASLRVSDSPTFKSAGVSYGTGRTNESLLFTLKCENDYPDATEQMVGNCIMYNGSKQFSTNAISINNGTLTQVCAVGSVHTKKGEVWKAQVWCNDTVSDSLKTNTTPVTIANTPPSFFNAANTSPTWERNYNFTAYINISDIDLDLTSCVFSTNASNPDGNWTNRTLTCPTTAGTRFVVSTNISIQENTTGAYWWEATDGTNITRTTTYTFSVLPDPEFGNFVIEEQGTWCTFNWTSNKQTTAVVYYGTNLSNLAWYTGKPEYETTHSITIAGLSFLTFYYANVTGCTTMDQCVSYIKNCTTTTSTVSAPETTEVFIKTASGRQGSSLSASDLIGTSTPTTTKLKENLKQTINTSFFSRLFSTIKSDNGVCEDAEWPFINEDCQLTTDALVCGDDSCIFDYLWFAKSLLLIGLVVVYRSKNPNRWYWYAALLLVLVVIYSPDLQSHLAGSMPDMGLPQRAGGGSLMDYGPGLVILALAALIFMYIKNRS